jgi:hypothetical protein
MQLDSVRELKSSLHESVVMPLAARATAGFYSLAAQPVQPLVRSNYRLLALGVARRKATDFVLAVRIQQRMLEGSAEVERIRKRAKGEVDVRYIGKAVKCAVPWFRQQNRPLRMGSSVGHFDVTAGSIGCFVAHAQTDDNTIMILSNNHVLANENRARKGDAILQPGTADGGKNPADAVARLERFIRLQKTAINRMDCAVAILESGVERSLNIIGIGNVAGVEQTGLYEQELVSKVGRTTGLSKGQVTAFELDDFTANFDLGNLKFDNLIEIEGADDAPFAQGGDSGSLVLNRAKEAVGLVFATTDIGGQNGKGYTYANPLAPILDKLQVKLLY